MTPHYGPTDAGRLLVDPRMVRRACDVVGNPAFARADARTTDAHGRRILDYVRSGAVRDQWPNRIAGLLTLPTTEFIAALAREPVKLSPIAKPEGGTRIVGVPTFTRRCVSNVFQEVLAQTGDHLVPKAVRAYRPGNAEAVRHAVLDVAEAVTKGQLTYFAKLDFSTYFAVMPWHSIEEALRHYGYDAAFTEKLMALVRCPLVRRERGQFVEVPSDRGAQMGLPESATLANLLPWELDEQFGRLAPRLFYVRYSDDLLLGSAHRSEVVGAVRTVQAWCRKHGIRLKGVSPDQRATTLVQDVRQARVEILGAEIDQGGRVHLPVPKLKKKLSEIERRCENLVTEGIIEGVSRYGDGGGSEKFDAADVSDVVDGFLDYWNQLDPEGARRAEALIRKTFPYARSPRSGGHGVVWVARLSGAQADDGAEVIDPDVHDARKTTGNPSDRSPSGTDRAGDAPTSEAASEDVSEDKGRTGRYGVRPGPSETSWVGAQVDDSRQEPCTEDCAEAVIPWEGVLSRGVEEEQYASSDGWDDGSSHGADGHRTNRFEDPSRDNLEAQNLDQEDLDLDLLLQEIDGAVADPALDEPPVPPAFANMPITYLAAERLRAPGPPVTMLATGFAVNGRLLGEPTAEAVVGRVDAAIARVALGFVAKANGRLVIAVHDTRIVKRLLQPHRRFRAPLMFGLVAALHAEARARQLDVRLAGGLPMPHGLERRLRRAVHEELLARTTRRNTLRASALGR